MIKKTDNKNIIVRIPVNLKTWGGRKVVISPQSPDLRNFNLEVRKDEKLLKALGRAYKWQKYLLTKKYANAQKIAEAEKINKSYMQRIMRLMLLSPRIIASILDGQQPEGFSLSRLEKRFSPIWKEQELEFNFKNIR